jgi:uncharacterized protein
MSPFAAVLRIPIRAYQLLLSPMLGPNCRFEPTCSCYALGALEEHGALRGSWLALGSIRYRARPSDPSALPVRSAASSRDHLKPCLHRATPNSAT